MSTSHQISFIDHLSDWAPRIERPIIITDHSVQELYGNALAQRLGCELVSVFPGEASKGIESYYEITRKMVQLKCTRKTTVIALGGGVIGDLAGFVAASFMRGVPCIQVPTTLLGMVDSSIGGKVGINLPEGKNLLGAFHHPQKVVIALNCLHSLPDKELHSGLSEVIKYGIIMDYPFFQWLEGNINSLLKKERKALKYAVKHCADLKVKVVGQDAKESNLRQILNYGHTYGHALEKITEYQQFTHGEAIAFGMQFEGLMALDRVGFSKKELKRQNSLLERIHPNLNLPTINSDSLIEAIQSDKKAVDDDAVFVLPVKIGEMALENGEYGIVVSQKVIHDTLYTYHSSHSL